jgi:hypothetical protein
MATGYLHVITTPVAADIFVNNEYRGTKDINIQLEQGTYTVTFGNVAGYVVPAQLSVVINPSFTALVTVEYVTG